MRHLHDRLFCGGEIIAQIHQRRANVAELALARAHDIGKLRDGRRRVAGVQVFAGIAQIDHDASKVRQMLRSHAQLTACRHDFVDLIRARRNFRGHFLRRIRQLFELRLRRVYGLSDRRERRLKIDRRLNRRRAQRRNRRGQRRGEQFSRFVQIFADAIAGFAEGLQTFSSLRPFGLRRFQFFIATGNVRPRLLHRSAGIVERGLRILHRVGGFADFIRIVDLLRRLQLLLCGGQRLFIFSNRLLLQPQFLLKQRQLRSKPCGRFIKILHARRSQTIAALGGFHLFSNGSDAALAGLNRFSGRRPAGARKGELTVALVDFCSGFFDRALRAVQFGLRRGECIRRVLRRLS